MSFGDFCGWACAIIWVYNEQVQSQFEQAYGTRPVLALSDLFYALHGVFVLLLLWSQCVLGHPLWGFQDRRRHRVHRVTQIILSLFIIFLVFNWFRRDLEFQLLSFSINLAYFKIGISCVKYIPQVIHNWKRKSMYGSSKAQIILDYTGSMFAVMEVLVKNDKPVLEAIALNRGKYGLIVISMIFDTIFTGQFYKYSSEDLKLPLKEKSVV
ncbi:DEKNAAC101691 [Brettanomyces naardenensis]|uniref:DEKNAAC101691 n=1 Tax=Brettanomyces naardenensis TaxID=13370 RepID=A0A448YJ14_BRENA|nr:DEKNAAC101691 [Brettanomyces naardenensis]